MRQCEVQIVSHRDTQGARLRQLHQRGKALQLLLNIEISGGLVEQQNLRLLGQARGQQDTLALASA